jgi:hypothetical protein
MIVKKPSENSKGSPWEQGSEFHLMENIRKDENYESPWNHNGLFFGSGRDSIKAILSLGMASMGWKRLWVPAYFCQKVVGAILETGINVQCYQSWYPGEMGENDCPCTVIGGDVVLVVNHFGLKSEIKLGFDISNAAAIIEDHTHDPWSSWAFNSKADYCIASLRKTLPVPDGGVLWSPRNQGLPILPSLTEEHRCAVGNKLEAMELKNLFLKGQITDKSRYRTLSLSGEANLCSRNVSAISEWTAQKLGEFPVFEWREARKRNHQALLEALSPLLWVQVIRSSIETDIVPFSCVLLFDSAERREFVRLRLIRANIFPAILWSLEKPAVQGIPEEHVDASKRMLSIHCDMRYSTQDMYRVADYVRNFGQEFDT